MHAQVHAELWRGDGCEQPGHDSQLQLSTGAEELHAHRMTRGSCQAGSWKDYYFDISEEVRHPPSRCPARLFTSHAAQARPQIPGFESRVI